MAEFGSLGLLRPILDDSDVPAIQQKILEREGRIRNVLGPLEPFLMYMQSILVWEKPKQSAVVLLCTNVIFWLATTTSYRFLFLTCFTASVIIFSEAWRTRIWPEIKVQQLHNQGADNEGWVPVHPHLMSLPEISRFIAEIWVTMSYYCSALWGLRQKHPGRFCIVMSTICVSLATLGHYISGTMLCYVIVMSILLWPCVFYHNLLQKAYIKVEPLMMRLEYKMKIKRKRSKKSKKGKKKKIDLSQDSVETESESDFDNFTPDPNPEITAALARAITDSEDENSSPSALTPKLSREPSIHSDDDELQESTLLAGLDEMPSFENVLNDTGSLASFLPPVSMPSVDNAHAEASDESLAKFTPGAIPSDSSVASTHSLANFLPQRFPSDLDTDPSSSSLTIEPGPIPSIAEVNRASSQERMHFVSTHYQNSSDSDREDPIDSLSHGLDPSAFPDIIDEDLNRNNQNGGSNQTETVAAFATDFLGTMVTSTISGLSKLSKNVKSMTQTKSDIKPAEKEKSENAQQISRHSSQESDLADFEFLNREDIGDE